MPNEGRNRQHLDIDVVNLTKSYKVNGRELKVFDNLSFSVERGTLIAIVGPSGCGKSTLLRILAGSEEAVWEDLYINPDRSKHSATIEQSPALFPWRTAFQNAHIGAEIRRTRLLAMFKEADDAALNKSVQDSFKLFRLSGFENSYPDELSGGMQQRVAIIRALQSGPDILFCDEPFSAIDFVTRLDLNTEFKRISREIGCTTVFVTHNIEEAIFLADRILVLNGSPSRIVADIPPQLTIKSEDAVKCRLSPEFPSLFDRIWQKLKTVK